MSNAHLSPLAPWLHRRDMLRLGAMGIGASLAPFGSPFAEAKEHSGKAKNIIFLWMAGGVTHIDSFDPKPNAPSEISGNLSAISTSLPGVQFCETMPEMAKVAHEIALMRSYSHGSNDHLDSQVYTLTGRKVTRAQLFTEPNIGSFFSHFFGPRNGLPAYVAVPGITRPGPPPHNFFLGGWLGSHHAPYCLGGLPEEPDFTATEPELNPPATYEEDLTPKSLTLGAQMDLDRLTRRAQLRDLFDRSMRTLDQDERVRTAETKYRGALRMLSLPQVRKAFEIDDESAAIRDDYGRTKIGGRCLMARRLVEAGARFVMVDYGYDPDYGNVWDNHNAPVQKHPPIVEMVKRGYHLAGMDKAFAALIRDMKQRGLLDSTLVVFVTEFGRTPKINANGGRDHWGAAGSVFFTGGGVRVGQVIGATDKHASEPTTKGYTPADIAATIYEAAGVNSKAYIMDIFDRPRPVLENGRPIPGVLA
jgi:hypothetical protein